MNVQELNAAVIGTTSWGTTLAILLARKGIVVNLLARTDEESERLVNDGQNTRFAPGIGFPPSLSITASPAQAVSRAQVIVIAVPSNTIRENIRLISNFVAQDTILVSATKGLEKQENNTLLFFIFFSIYSKFFENF